MNNPTQPFQKQLELRKLETELGFLGARVESATAGLRECLTQCLRRSSRELPVPNPTDRQTLVSVLRAELGELEPSAAEDEQIHADLLLRASALFSEADEVARGAFVTGALCHHSRNVLYRLKSQRFEECGLRIERVQKLAEEATSVEERLAVLLFALRTERGFADAFRTIHPRTVAESVSVNDQSA